MKRKLLNGFLVLALAAGGVGTFTSCKDENVTGDLQLDNASLQAQLEAIRTVTDKEFNEKLLEWLDTMTELYSGNAGTGEFDSYEDLVVASDKLYDIYQNIISNEPLNELSSAYVDALYRWLFNNEIVKEDWYKLIFDTAYVRATSVEVNQTYNPVFGSINLPVGLKTTVLATYMVNGVSGEVKFPAHAPISEFSPYRPGDGDMILTTINSLVEEEVAIVDGDYTTEEGSYGEMGSAYVTINPTGIDFSGSAYSYSLINSQGDEVVGNDDLKVAVNEDLLTFGYTSTDGSRANGTASTGVYKVGVNASENVKVVDMFKEAKGFVEDVKTFIDEKSLSNLAFIGEYLYKKVADVGLPALALKVEWDEVNATEGNSTAPKGSTETVKNSVISNFDLAAVVVKPLSYGSLDAYSDKMGSVGDNWANKIPTFSPLEEYLEKISNKLTIDGQTFDITYDDTTTNPTLTVNWTDEDGDHSLTLKVVAGDLTSAQPLNSDEVPEAVAAALVGLQKEVESMMAAVEPIQNLVDRIKNSSKLVYADKLITVYNQLAEKVQNVLRNPAHYLQVAALYSDQNGHYHHLSTDANVPTVVKVANADDAIELLLASYTGDVVVPSYKKYVAVTKVGNNVAKAADNKGENINVVFPGQQHRAALTVGGFNNGDVLTVSYLSCDYQGVVSMQNYYIKVVK